MNPVLDKNEISSIAIFRALQLGDMLCIIPTVRAIRAAYPEASITLIGLPWQIDLVKRFPNYFDSFVEFPGWPGLPEIPWEAERSVAFVKTMQERKFDLVFQMQGNGILTNSMCLLWDGKFTVGLRKSSEFISKGIYTVSEDTDHEILRFLKILEPIGIEPKGTHLEFPISEGERQLFHASSETLGIKNKKYVCIHPGARDPKRRWNLENFAQVADAVHQHGYEVVLTGSVFELDIMNKLASLATAPVINSVERLNDVSLGHLAAIINSSSLLISNDTGVSHIASALKVPSVIIFSPFSDQNRWAPLNSKLHIPISSQSATDVNEVITSVLDHLKLNRLHSSSPWGI
ncbi:MAG TPA: glycosyltransferase family 9 protein [Chryseosolibacter sp.]